MAYLYCECSICGQGTQYKLTEEELRTYEEYEIRGIEMGMLQDLFPNVPGWIRSGAIDKRSGGFCICPKCCGME